MVSYVSNPRVTLNIIARDALVGLEEHRVLFVGQKTSAGSAAAGFNRETPRTAAEINALYGARSHLACMLRAFREINPYTHVDVLALADNGSGTAATGVITFTGTATAAATIYVSVGSAQNNRYELNIANGDTATAIGAALTALITADTSAPFTAANSTGAVTCTAANKGTLANNYLISVLDAYDRPVAVPGITVAITGWTGGATNPTLTNLFDPVDGIRYQTVVWPEGYTLATAQTFIDARKNVDNNIMDGTVYVFSNDTYSNVKTTSLATNSSEIVLMTNEKVNATEWKGPHIPEICDVVAARVAASVSLRFEDGFSISNIVSTNEPLDQFGGIHTASLPYFNTKLLNTKRPLSGTGYSFAEQLDLEKHGVTVIGYNRPNNAIILGQVVTTYQNDPAGNADDTWKWLEWRHTHGVIREYFVLNCRKEFSQYRMSRGTAVPGYAIANEEVIRAFLYQLYDTLADLALTVKGRGFRKLFEDRLVVTLDPGNRRATINADVPMVSQLGEIQGTVKFNFQPGAAA